ncbi:uncharacterized protein ACRADG_007876 [Cochliomyia hominivorax]
MNKLMEIVLEATQPTFNLSLILATLYIINTDYAKYATTVTIGEYAINRRNQFFHNYLINEILKRNTITPNIKFYTENEIQEYISDQEMEKESDTNQLQLHLEDCIWFLDSLTSYLKFENFLLKSNLNFQRNGYFLLIYTGEENKSLSNMRVIFHRLFNLYCINVNILLMIDNTAKLYTYFPFKNEKCHFSKPELNISFRNIEKNFTNYKVKRKIFENKLDNMHGCELTVATFPDAPYVMIDKDPESGNLTRLHGIEGSLLSLMAESMNFKIKLKIPETPDRGVVYPNDTITELKRMVMNAEANISMVTMIHYKGNYKEVQPSYAYLHIPYVLAIPLGPKMTSLQRLIKPFHYIIWFCFNSSLMLGILLIYFLRFLGRSKLMYFIFGGGNRTPFTNLISTLCGVSILNLPKRNFARFLLAVFLLYTIIFRSAYSGALYNLLQDGRQRHTYKTISELVDNNFTIYGFPVVLKVLNETFPKAHTVELSTNNSFGPLLERISSSSDEKIAVSLLEYSARYYNQQNVNNRVNILDEDILLAPIVFYMPLHSYLRHEGDYLLLYILTSGLIEHYKSYYLYSPRRAQLNEDREPTKLTVSLLFSVFNLYLILLLFALLIFLLELCTLKSITCKVIVDFLNI